MHVKKKNLSAVILMRLGEEKEEEEATQTCFAHLDLYLLFYKRV